MKTKNQMKPLARLIATSLAVGSMAGFGTQVLAQTAAGTLIKNLATVTYEDANGNEYSAQSNEAVVTVAPVYSAVIEKDNALSAAPGQTVYFPHILSNTGNIADTYTLAISDTTDSIPVTVYNDLNANGQPDPGEPKLSDIEIGAGEQKNIVVAMEVPVDADSTDTYSTTLTATTPNATVKDENDNLDGNNVDTAAVSTGPILVLNKSSVHNVDTKEITYTLTVKNNGGSDATNVNIEDILPVVDHDSDGNPVTGTAGKQVALVSIDTTTDGGLVNTGDEVGAPGTVTDIDDLNNDGSVTDSLNTIVATDVTLPPNTTISVTYTVSYAKAITGDALEWAAGEGVDNTFTASSTEITVPVSSNTTHDVIPTIYGVLATDTELDSADGVNDGGDDVQPVTDDIDDTQYVDVSPTGGEVLFKHIITNNGNGDDVFNLDVLSVDFPTNTVFTFWDETGVVQLTDTDNDGVPDTGTLTQNESLPIMVKAKLPAGVTGTDLDATLTTTSSGDPSVKDVTHLRLGTITAPTVDIANNNLTVGQGMTGIDLTETSPQAENAQNESPAWSAEAAVGGVVVFDLVVANESGSADSYLLSTGVIPTGWDVKFKDLDGNVITTTPLIPGGKIFEYTAEVTISSDPSEALHDLPAADGGVDGYNLTNGDTTAALVPGVSTTESTRDEDGDYLISFNAASTSTDGLSDTVTNTVDVLPDREVVITPNGQNQIQPGGTVDYSHKIENNGNMDEPVVISVDNTEDGWTTVIKIDTDGDGVPDAVLAEGITDTITIPVPGGDPIVIDVTYDDDNAEMILPAGVDIAISAVVNAPSNAPLGAVNNSTITVEDNTSNLPNPPANHVNSDPVSAQDQTNVILGQVRLDKKAAIDEGCDGTLETGFSANQAEQVKPEDCVVWRLTATNEGNAVVNNVVISDAAPDYTTLQTVAPNALKLCFGNAAACDAEPLTSASDGTTSDVNSGLVTFKPWDPVKSAFVGLEPGQKITGEFTVKID